VDSQSRIIAGGEYVLERVIHALRDEKGIHAESLLTCLGALAGYACQVYVRQAASLPGSDPRKFALTIVETRDGSKYCSGDALNRPLAESAYSVWELICGAVQKAGQPPPDLADIFKHVAGTIGGNEFGVPRIPEGNRPRHLPLVYLKDLWPQILPVAQKYCGKPLQLPMVFGLAVHKAIEKMKDVVDPTLGARIAMESAVAMSKVILSDTAPKSARAPAAAAAAAPTHAPAPARTSASAPASASTPVAPLRLTAAAKRRRALEAQQPPSTASVLESLPFGPRMVAIMGIVLVSIVAGAWRMERSQARAAERQAQELRQQQDREGTRYLEQLAREAEARDKLQKMEQPVSMNVGTQDWPSPGSTRRPD
jgi:hypothetical protein